MGILIVLAIIIGAFLYYESTKEQCEQASGLFFVVGIDATLVINF